MGSFPERYNDPVVAGAQMTFLALKLWDVTLKPP